ncbi:MAG: hypothetical protein AAF747_04380 [Planctomycetota bacterium]
MRSLLQSSLATAALLAAASTATAQQTEITFTFGGFANPQNGQIIVPFDFIRQGETLTIDSPPSAGTLIAADAYEISFEPVFGQTTGGVGALNPLGAFGLPLPLRPVLPLFGNFIPDAVERLFDGQFRNPTGQLGSDLGTREVNFSGQGFIPFNFSFAYGGRVNEDGSFTFRVTDVDLTDTTTGQPAGEIGLFNNVVGFSYPNIPELNLNFAVTPPLNDPNLDFRGDLAPSTRVTVRAITVPDTRGAGEQTEWRFDNSNLDAAYGPALLTELDNPAFLSTPAGQEGLFGNPVLLSINEEPDPNSSDPNDDRDIALPNATGGLTASLDDYGLASAFGVPAINGVDPTVYKTAPTDDPNEFTIDTARGIGLLLYPTTATDYRLTGSDFDVFNSQRNIQEYTMVWDIYIPQSTWDRQFPFGFFNDSVTNNASGFDPPIIDAADFIISRDPFGGTIFGNGVLIGTAPSNVNGKLVDPGTTDFGPDRWMRIAIVVDDEFERNASIYINGNLITTLAYSEPLLNRVDPLDPVWSRFAGDQTPITPIDPAVWSQWGGIPNPWVDFQNHGADGEPIDTDLRYQLFSQFCVFCEPGGRAGEAYVANFLFAERLFSDTELATLGGPNAAGISFCRVDYNQSGDIDAADTNTYLNLLNTNDDAADLNGDDESNYFDVIRFLDAC